MKFLYPQDLGGALGIAVPCNVSFNQLFVLVALYWVTLRP